MTVDGYNKSLMHTDRDYVGLRWSTYQMKGAIVNGAIVGKGD